MTDKRGMLAAVARAHEAWALEHGDEVGSEADAELYGDEYREFSADVSAPSSVDDPLNEELQRLIQSPEQATATPAAKLLPILNRTYKRDKDGRFGSGGVRQPLADAATIKDLDKAAGAEAKRITGRNIPFKMGGDVQLAREHCEGVLRGLERFPEAKLIGVTVSTFRSPNETAYALHTNGIISFNATWAGAPEVYRASLKRSAKDGWSPRGGGGPIGTALHEFGHEVDIHTLGSVRVDGVLADHAKGWTRSADDYVQGRSATESMIHSEVSGYALKNHHELVAEAFADVMVNGPAASALSHDIFGAVDAAYRDEGLRPGEGGGGG